jgi:hypothetical protein
VTTFLMALMKARRCPPPPTPLVIGRYGPPSLKCGLAVLQFN